MYLAVLGLFVACVLSGCSLWSAKAPDSGEPELPIPLLGDDPISLLSRPQSDRAKTEIVSVEGQAFDKAMRLETLIIPENTYNIQLSARTKVPIQEGDKLRLTFSLRGIWTDQTDDKYTVAWVWEERGQQNNRKMTSINQLDNLTADGEWTHFVEEFEAPFDVMEELSQVAFRFGFHMQTVELGGLQLWKLPN